MRILIVDTYYPGFLADVYAADPGLCEQPYADQHAALMAQCFGTSNYYSTHLNELGHDAEEVVANCEPLQRAWARENRLDLSKDAHQWTLRRGLVPWRRTLTDSDWMPRVLEAQIKTYLADVLYIQDMHAIDAAFLRAIRPSVRKIVGQIASPMAPGADYRPYDLILTSFPHFVDRFRAQGLKSEYFKIGFEPAVLSKLKKTGRHPVVFAGGLSPDHSERIQLLEAIAKQHPLEIYGYGAERLPDSSPLKALHRGPAWALDMYTILYNSDIALNHHIDVAENNANNMRLYEATGVGTLLLTDRKDNLGQIFEVGKEVVDYGSPEEAVEKIGHYLTHPDQAQAIADAGQGRTLRDHTYENRMEELSSILARIL